MQISFNPYMSNINRQQKVNFKANPQKYENLVFELISKNTKLYDVDTVTQSGTHAGWFVTEVLKKNIKPTENNIKAFKIALQKVIDEGKQPVQIMLEQVKSVFIK